MTAIRIILSMLMLLALLACDQAQQTPAQLNNANEISRLQDAVKGLEERVSSVQSDNFMLKLRQEQYDSTAFDPAEGSGYGRVETTSGTFLVSLQEVVPYLDGVRVKLHIGNIQIATYNGFELEAEYGKRYPKFDVKRPREERDKLFAEATASRKKKSEKFLLILRPGSWNVVHMNLPEVKPDAFGFLTISMKTSQVSLSGGR